MVGDPRLLGEAQRLVDGTASFVFIQKLKLLKECIVRWKKEEFGRLESKKLAGLKKIEELKQKGMVEGLDAEELGVKAEAEQDYNRLLRMEEISWR